MKRSRGRIDLLDKDGRTTGARKQKRVKIAIAVPSRGVCPTNFAWSLANLILHSGHALTTTGLADLTVGFNEGTYIHTNRNDLAGESLKEGADYILWLDDDMLFPPDALIALLEHNVSIVGANYPTRKVPITPVAIKHIGDNSKQPPERVQTREGDTGLERAEAIGFGCALIKAEVFWDVGFPWFESKRDVEMDRWVGEDVDFCIKARAAGHDVFVDHGLSQEVRHIGQMEYSVAHAVAYAEEESHGTDDLRGTADDDQQLAESGRLDDASDHTGLHPTGGGEAEPEGGDPR